jgi:hypothetical protein
MTTPEQSTGSAGNGGSESLADASGPTTQIGTMEAKGSPDDVGAANLIKADPAAPRGRLKTGFTWIKTGLEVVAAVATIAAIIFALVQFRIAKHDARVNETLAYVARFNSDPVIDSYNKMYEAFLSSLKPAGGPKSGALDWETKLALNNNLNWNVIQVGDFFDQLYICISNNICDRELALTMLERDIETAYVLSGKYLEKNWPPTGCGLLALGNLIQKRGQHGSSKVELKTGACPD